MLCLKGKGKKNRDVCLIETINHITTNNCYCFFFLSMKTLCLSCFVGYHRSILCDFEISFHRFLLYLPYVSHLMCFSPIQKYLFSCFHILKNICTTQLENMNILKKIRIPIVQKEISVICESCGNLRDVHVI